jgi:hypothetical protein
LVHQEKLHHHVEDKNHIDDPVHNKDSVNFVSNNPTSKGVKIATKHKALMLTMSHRCIHMLESGLMT